MGRCLPFLLLVLVTVFGGRSAISILDLVAINSTSITGVINSTDDLAYVNYTLDFLADSGSLDTYNYLVGTATHAGEEVTVNYAESYGPPILDGPTMRFAHSIQSTGRTTSDGDDIFELSWYVANLPGSLDAGNVEIACFLDAGLKLNLPKLSSSISAGNYSVNSKRNFIVWYVGNMTAGYNLTANGTADVFREDMQDGHNLFPCYLTYTNTTDPNSQEFGPLTAEVCIDANIETNQSILYQHGFTALAFFMALILGVLLVCLVFFIYHFMRRKKSVSPSKANGEAMMVKRGKTIMMDENEAFKKQGHTINDYSVIGEGDSIVGVLGMKDKMQMHREIDSLDIVNTVNIDTGLEKERNDASVATTELLITGLHSNKDINKSVMDNAISNLRSRRKHLDNQQDEDYKREMKKLYKKISAKNRAMMNNLLQKQREEKKELVSNTQDLPAKERNEMIKLMNEQHLSEQNAETYRLKLEQDEETEKLRKEYAIRGRMGLKELQLQALTDVRTQGNLSDPQVKWLLSEHQKTQKSLEAMYDDEISRQRMNLEEKLARRKALAQEAETQEEDTDDLLNTVAGQQMSAIEKMRKGKAISSADANVLIDQSKQEMIAIKNKMESNRSKQENELHKRLSDLKKKRLSDLSKEHIGEINEYDRKCKEMQTDGPVDPLTYADGRLKLLSQQRVERNNLENEIDTSNTQELTKMRSEMCTQTEQELRHVADHLKEKLDPDHQSQLDQLLRDHERETAALQVSQEKNRQKMMRKLQDRLEESREQWSQRKEAEKMEQEQLREYEDNVVSKLVNSQVSMSDDERARIMKEHEKQMVQLENSLTLNKLRQKRMIEDKIAQRRAAQMEKLGLKQHKEKEAQRRKMENNAEESDDEDAQRKKLELMKEHVEQKMAVLQGRKMDWDTELESIRVEMLKERSAALKDQEEKLGALVAGLQLSKAKELAKIEEQQRAIHNLKTNLIDDLNSRGVLTDPETQAVIKRHQEEQEVLNQRLDGQRLQQEQILRQKLQMRLQQREKSMVQKQDEELKMLVAPNKTAAKIKKMLMIHNHMVAMEKMRNQLEREISQTLEQVRYEYEVCKRRAIQDQEMEFIAGLTRVGTIPKEELESVIQTLYPGKSEQELQEILNKIFDPKLQTNKPPMDHAQASHLLSRVKNSQANPPPFLRRTSSISQQRSPRKPRKQRSNDQFNPGLEQQQHYDMDHYEDNSRFRPSSRQFEDQPRFPHPAARRSLGNSTGFSVEDRQSYDQAPHPLEESYSSTRQNGYANRQPVVEEDNDIATAMYVSGDQRQPPSKLPPLEPTGRRKKKKKKFLKKVAQDSPRHHDDDDDF
ncbi:trichohyalin-like isoform X2 [Mya arenaria]|uniref:trichohyalin-like isoform X2 n=1 Tax=Mya arenaria TaxID=6604 RepID=UPI0022E33A25|nr:trichohyalin-like isoform X2 [Mya arenaria]